MHPQHTQESREQENIPTKPLVHEAATDPMNEVTADMMRKLNFRET